MSETQLEDPFSTALTEIERLLVVWDDLTAAGVADSPIANLVHKSIADLSVARRHVDSIISIQNFSRLLEIWSSVKSRETIWASHHGYILRFIMKKLTQMKDADAVSRFDKTPKATLQRLEDLEHWSALKTKVEKKFPSEIIGRRIAAIISLGVKALPVHLNASSDSLRLIEIGAKLLKALPHQHHAKISQIIDPKIKALTRSNGECEARHACTSASQANVGDDRAVQAIAHASEKLAAAEDAHVKITVDFENKIQALVEQNLLHEATINRPAHDKVVLTQDKLGLEGRVHDLTQELSSIQSSETDLQQENLGLQSELMELRSENARLEKKFGHSKSKHQNRIRKLKEEVATLRQNLLDQEYAHDTDDKTYDESFQSRAEKLTEELAEAIDDKAELAREYEQLAVEKSSAEESLAESEDSKAAMSNEIYELVLKNDRLEQELKDASDSLEEAEDDRATLFRNVGNLTNERARLEGALTDAQDILHRISSFSSSIRPTATEPSSRVSNAHVDANANADTETETSSVGVLTPASSGQTTPW